MKALKPALLALGCALLLVATHQVTRAVIADNQQQYAERQLRAMAEGFELAQDEHGYGLLAAGKPVGRITPVTTNAGYNGRIALLVAWLDNGEIINVRVTSHQETPGIGDAIELPVSDWMLGFNGRSPASSRWALAPVGDIDGITGATITSRAVVAAVAEATRQ